MTFSVSGLRLGRGLQAADRPGAGSEAVPGPQGKGRLPGHLGQLPPASAPQLVAPADAALHRFSRRSQLPGPRPSRGDSQSDRQL